MYLLLCNYNELCVCVCLCASVHRPHLIFKIFELFSGEQASGLGLQQYGSISLAFQVFPGEVAACVVLQCDCGSLFALILQEALPCVHHCLETHQSLTQLSEEREEATTKDSLLHINGTLTMNEMVTYFNKLFPVSVRAPIFLHSHSCTSFPNEILPTEQHKTTAI